MSACSERGRQQWVQCKMEWFPLVRVGAAAESCGYEDGGVSRSVEREAADYWRVATQAQCQLPPALAL